MTGPNLFFSNLTHFPSKLLGVETINVLLGTSKLHNGQDEIFVCSVFSHNKTLSC